jgi:hypothetical protein
MGETFCSGRIPERSHRWLRREAGGSLLPAAFLKRRRRLSMDEFNEGYQAEEYEILPSGVYQVKIANVTKGESKSSGLPMLTVEMVPMKNKAAGNEAEGTSKEIPVTLKHFIVKNENYNKNMTKFFDCFKIDRNDFEYMNWIDKTGKAYIGKTEGVKQYHEIKYLIVEEEA